MILKTLLILNIILILPLSALSETSVYRWVDEDGHVHFDSKPKKDHAKKIKIKNSVSDKRNNKNLSTEERVKKQKRYLDSQEAEKKAIKNEKLKQQKKVEDNLRRCAASRDQLKRAEESRALYDLDEKGNRILLNSKQYELAMKQARARVIKWCN